MIIHNIANDRDSGGYFYSSENYHQTQIISSRALFRGSPLLFDEKKENF